MIPEKYFQLLQNLFDKNQNDQIAKTYLIGGCVFELRFLTREAYQAFKPSFEEAGQGSVPDFRVRVWDRAASATKLIPAWWSKSAYKKKGEIEGFSNGHYRFVYDLGSQALSAADFKNRVAHYWTPSFHTLPYWEKGSPLRNIIHWFLPMKKRYLVHSAAVGNQEGGVLIVGKGGAGKSTTALSCLATELSYTADDYCAVSDDEHPVAYQVFSSAKISPQAGKFFGNQEVDLPSEKVVVPVHELYQGRSLRSFPVKGILLPQITSNPIPKLLPSSKGLILRELSASTIFQLPGRNEHLLPILASIVKKVPCYTLALSPEFTENARLISAFVRSPHVC